MKKVTSFFKWVGMYIFGNTPNFKKFRKYMRTIPSGTPVEVKVVGSNSRITISNKDVIIIACDTNDFFREAAYISSRHRGVKHFLEVADDVLRSFKEKANEEIIGNLETIESKN